MLHNYRHTQHITALSEQPEELSSRALHRLCCLNGEGGGVAVFEGYCVQWHNAREGYCLHGGKSPWWT